MGDISHLEKTYTYSLALLVSDFSIKLLEAIADTLLLKTRK